MSARDAVAVVDHPPVLLGELWVRRERFGKPVLPSGLLFQLALNLIPERRAVLGHLVVLQAVEWVGSRGLLPALLPALLPLPLLPLPLLPLPLLPLPLPLLPAGARLRLAGHWIWLVSGL